MFLHLAYAGSKENDPDEWYKTINYVLFTLFLLYCLRG